VREVAKKLNPEGRRDLAIVVGETNFLPGFPPCHFI